MAAFRSRIGKSPTLFFSVYGVKGSTRRLRVRRTSCIVIEGFPRSANSFAVLAFAAAQGRTPEDLGIAHHLHVPAQVQLGARFGIPALVLARNPVDAVTSLLIREPWRAFDRSFADYCTFYREVLRLPEDSYVIGLFPHVTSRFGSVIEAVNRRFGCEFEPFQHDEDSVRAVYGQLEALEAHEGGVRERAVARPSHRRERLKTAVRERLETEADAGLIREATALFQALRRQAEAG